MKTTIVTGLLGAGKTTFIQRFLGESREKAVVLVNDFGKSGIDGEIFSAGGIEFIELPSGCVCCTLKIDLVAAVKRIIADFSPDHLVIEPSGVASPSGVLEALESIPLTGATVVGVVDATEFVELYEAQMYGDFFNDQISNADLILVNKTDIADEGSISETMKIIQKLNPRAVIMRSVRGVISEPMPVFSAGGRILRKEDCHFIFESISFRLPGKIDYSLLETLFADLARGRYGRVARAKGLLQTTIGPYRFDLSYGKIDTASFPKTIEDGRLVIIGEGLDTGAVRSLLGGTGRYR